MAEIGSSRERAGYATGGTVGNSSHRAGTPPNHTRRGAEVLDAPGAGAFRASPRECTGTDLDVPQSDRHADAYRVAAIRRTFPVPADAAAARATRPADRPTPVVPLFQPAPIVADDVKRVGVLVPMDGQNRIAATKVTKLLGWTGGTSLVARCSGGRVMVTVGNRRGAAQLAVPLDSSGRLTLPPAVCATVRARAGEQVLAVAIPDTGELVLACAADALAAATGPVNVAAAAPGRPRTQPRPSSRVRAAFVAEPAS